MVNGNPLKSNDVQNPLQTARFGPDNIPVPRNGGNGSCSEDMRKEHTLIRYGELLGRLINNIESLPAAARTARRHKRRVRELGRNKIHPKATRYECLAFLWRSYGSYLPVPQLYSLKNVSEAENVIGINRNKGSTSTANQAFTFRNLYKRFRYWTMDYPFGIADIRRDDMIDVDEAGIKLEHANKKMGKCSLCGRVQQRGNYGHGVNHTLKIAIASNQEGQQWVRFDTAGTAVFSFAAFIESILEDLPPGIDGNRKCFIPLSMPDTNLSSELHTILSMVQLSMSSTPLRWL
eukprot:jgi/Psemu1/19608/gm1.19608_g